MTKMLRYGLLAPLFIAYSAALAQPQEETAETADNPQEAPPQPAPPSVADEMLVDLTELVAQVAEADGREFIVDSRVGGRAYVVPRIETPTYASLLAVLRIHGYVAVASGERVYVVPDGFSRFMPTRVLENDDETIPDDEVVGRVIEVANATRLVAILRPLLPQYAHLAATENKLMIVDRYDNVRRIAALARALAE